jgi:hypothetical protein
MVDPSVGRVDLAWTGDSSIVAVVTALRARAGESARRYWTVCGRDHQHS